MGYLRDIFRQYLGENVVLFTVGMYDFSFLGYLVILFEMVMAWAISNVEQ